VVVAVCPSADVSTVAPTAQPEEESSGDNGAAASWTAASWVGDWAAATDLVIVAPACAAAAETAGLLLAGDGAWWCDGVPRCVVAKPTPAVLARLFEAPWRRAGGGGGSAVAGGGPGAQWTWD